MVAISSLAFAAAAIAGSLASPAHTATRNIKERSPGDFTLRRDNAISRRQSSPNYNQDYTTGGTVDYSPSGGSFSVTWNTEDDFVVGVGWTTGSTL
jgi:endo-1,4-beta-xylanase